MLISCGGFFSKEFNFHLVSKSKVGFLIFFFFLGGGGGGGEFRNLSMVAHGVGGVSVRLMGRWVWSMEKYQKGLGGVL
jgi:hypothetical protein